MTWKLWLLTGGVLLAAGSVRALAQEAAPNDNTSQPGAAPYYNQIADIIYPENRGCSEPSQWVGLFNAMSRQRRTAEDGQPARKRCGDELRVSYSRAVELPLISQRKLRQVHTLLAELEVVTEAEEQRPVTDKPIVVRVLGVEECEAGATNVGPQQPDAACAELGNNRTVSNPESLSRPVQPMEVPSGTEPVPHNPGPAIPYLPMVHHKLGQVVEPSRTQSVLETAVVRQHLVIRGDVQIVRDNPCRLALPGIKATADSMRFLPETHQVLLEGHVEMDLEMENQPAKVLTHRALINTRTGEYEVMPLLLDERWNIPASEVVPLTPAARGWR